VNAFLRAAVVPREGDHGSGTLAEARAILSSAPDLATMSIHAAAALGDADRVRDHIGRDAALATAKGDPYEWDALTYLCFSRFLRLDRARSGGFVAAAEALLDAGADPNTGWFERSHQPKPEFESAIYGAAGIARDPDLTRLLLAHGADPNDEETPYHAPETYDNATIRVLLDSGRMNADSLSTMLLRKTDWHDFEGLWLLLHSGVDPNHRSRFGRRTALHHGLLRDNGLTAIELLLSAGADATQDSDIGVPAAIAARRGRFDVLQLFARTGIASDLSGVDALLAACACHDEAAIDRLSAAAPQTIASLKTDGAPALGAFAGTGNTEGVRRLLDLGVPVDARWADGDAYYGTAPDSTALHVAAWRARHGVVKLLLARGADVDARDGEQRTPLALAIRACVDSFWTQRRSPESVEALLRAGASLADVRYPSGYDEVDAVMRQYGAGGS
jgi:ankyrin repeat protein